MGMPMFVQISRSHTVKTFFSTRKFRFRIFHTPPEFLRKSYGFFLIHCIVLRYSKVVLKTTQFCLCYKTRNECLRYCMSTRKVVEQQVKSFKVTKRQYIFNVTV